MSNIFALAEDAQRRVEGASQSRAVPYEPHRHTSAQNINGEKLLLLTVILILLYANASPILLLAILYVTL